MSYRITAGYPISMIQESGEVGEILQNVATILSTPKGTAPLYRDFGIDTDFLDRPIQVARTLMISRVTEAVEEFEPRARVVRVTVEIDKNNTGRLIPTVEVEIE